MKKEVRKTPKGVNDLKHTTIWAKDSEWEALKEAAASKGKSTSAYIEDKLLDYLEKNGAKDPKPLTRESHDGNGKIHALAFNKDSLASFKEAAESVGMSMSYFILSAVINGASRKKGK